MTQDEQKYYKAQGAMLKKVRKEAGKTRYEVAEFFNVKYNYISTIERGEKPLSTFNLMRWGIFLGVSFLLENGSVKGYRKAGE